jgi:glyceraldehyde 3-phosphate dehydrogenase
MKKIAINGLGRIGRLTLRHLLANPHIEVVAINDLTNIETVAHLMRYDTAQGKLQWPVNTSDDAFEINGQRIPYFSERDPSNLPWGKLDVDLVLECTGVFRDKASVQKHLDAGAKKVVISAPAKGDDIPFVVLGVNEEVITPGLEVISNASCTTNCLAPVVKVINDEFGISHGFVTTTHGYTADQRLQDAPHADLRRARAAAQNIIPTSTGAAKALGVVIPAMKGKLSASALRVPVITGSLIELTCIVEKNTNVEEVNAKIQEAANGALSGVLEYTEAPIVSSDIIGNTHSSIFDSQLTDVNQNMIKVTSWYDNEAGFSARMAELVEKF